MLGTLWKRRKAEVRTGLDLGSHSAKLLQVAFQDGKAEEVVSATTFSGSILDQLQASLVNVCPVVHWRCSLTNMKSVHLSEGLGGVAERLAYEAERFMPYSVSEAQLSWLPLGGADYWLALAPTELIAQLRQRFAGPIQLELVPEFALWRLAPGTVIIDAGHEFTKISQLGRALWRPAGEDVQASLSHFDRADPLWAGGNAPHGSSRIDPGKALGLAPGCLGPEFAVAAGLLLEPVGPERLFLD